MAGDHHRLFLAVEHLREVSRLHRTLRDIGTGADVPTQLMAAIDHLVAEYETREPPASTPEPVPVRVHVEVRRRGAAPGVLGAQHELVLYPGQTYSSGPFLIGPGSTDEAELRVRLPQ